MCAVGTQANIRTAFADWGGVHWLAWRWFHDYTEIIPRQWCRFFLLSAVEPEHR